MEPVDTLVCARWVLPVEPNGTVLADHSVAMRDGRIVAVLPTAAALATYTPAELVDRPQHAILPGLVNAHTHAAMTLLRGVGDDLPLKNPEPANEDDWVRVAMDQNLALVSSRLAADIARDDVRSAFGGHLPSIDLTASYGNQKTTTDQTFPPFPPNFPAERAIALDNDSDATLVGLQLTLPLFSGGGTRSRVRQQEYQWQAARQRLERTSRQTERQARDAFLGVTSEISRVNALKQALESSRTALQATEAGYEVGTRTTVDVLEARRNLVQALTNLSRSKYDYLLNVIQLRQAAGTLDKSALGEINGWLDLTVTTVPAPPQAEPAPTAPPSSP